MRGLVRGPFFVYVAYVVGRTGTQGALVPVPLGFQQSRALRARSRMLIFPVPRCDINDINDKRPYCLVANQRSEGRPPVFSVSRLAEVVLEKEPRALRSGWPSHSAGSSSGFRFWFTPEGSRVAGGAIRLQRCPPGRHRRCTAPIARHSPTPPWRPSNEAPDYGRYLSSSA